jgi:hypothetical protein
MAAANGNAVDRLTEIERAIAVLGDEDVLDLADITRTMPDTALTEMVRAEMTRRSISL